MSEFSRRERQILDILFKANEATATEIRAAMDDPPSDATVRTILRVLEEKDAVTHRQEGKKYVYRPKLQKANAGKSALRRVLNVFFDGSLKDAVAAHLADPKTSLDSETIDNLRQLIEDAEGKTGQGKTTQSKATQRKKSKTDSKRKRNEQ